MSALGWVIIERNQASGWPEVLDGTIFTVEQEAVEQAALLEADNRKRSRREQYSIAQVVEEMRVAPHACCKANMPPLSFTRQPGAEFECPSCGGRWIWDDDEAEGGAWYWDPEQDSQEQGE